jgi:hypothetical protein
MAEGPLTQREKILQRMLKIAEGIDEVEEASRNSALADTSPIRRITILEGEEQVPEEPFSNRKASDKTSVLMIPEWLIDCGASSSENAGSDLNRFFGRCINAVLNDEDLLALTVNGRSIRYGGMSSDLSFMALMQGRMALKFRILYALDPKGP